jgi:hypothetical protein
MFGLQSLRKARADAEYWRMRYDDVFGRLLVAYDEISRIHAELSRWKPDRDARGRFTHAAAIMPEIADRDCSFVERGGM